MAQRAATSIATRRRRSSGPRLGELIEAFLDQLASGGASTHTVGAYRRDLRGVAERMATAQAWSSLFAYLIAEGIARANPTEAAQRPKPPPPAPKLIAGGDVSERLLSAAAMPEASSPSA